MGERRTARAGVLPGSPVDPLEVAIANGWFDEFADLVEDILEAGSSSPLQRAAQAWGTATLHGTDISGAPRGQALALALAPAGPPTDSVA